VHRRKKSGRESSGLSQVGGAERRAVDGVGKGGTMTYSAASAVIDLGGGNRRGKEGEGNIPDRGGGISQLMLSMVVLLCMNSLERGGEKICVRAIVTRHAQIGKFVGKINPHGMGGELAST